MNEMAQYLGYGVMAIGGSFIVLFGLYLVWAGFCGAAVGFIRSLRAIKSARKASRNA